MTRSTEGGTNEICLIAPTDQLAERANEIIRQERLPITVRKGALDEAVAIAEELMEQGTWLFISRKGTRYALEKCLNAKSIGIPLEASDYIHAIEKAREKKGLIAFFSFEELSNELRTICYLLGIHMRCYRFTDNQSCRESVGQAYRDGAVFGIGGVVSEFWAKELGMEHMIVESSESSIRQAVETACQMLDLHREDERKREEMQIRLERYENIFNYTHDAIIAVDSRGRVDVINQVARQMLVPGTDTYIGRPIEEIMPNTRINAVLRSGKMETDQLMKVNDTLVSTNRIPIIVNGRTKGVVATFRDIKSLQTAEQNIRLKLHQKGLTAKYRFTDILGDSDAIKEARELAETFADSQYTVMLYGETGTGKELFAQSIHNASSRRNGPFVAVNCTALSKSLLESELFGYADSSFTGAKRGGKAGLFELAHGGTIFLDEIGELPMEIQAQFLRVLQEKEVRRVGGDTLIPVDIRVIGATNRNLIRRVDEGHFRRDLYYRLNVLNVTLPPLRERGDDYMIIAMSLVDRYLPDRLDAERERFVKILMRYQDYSWPGNIRELTNVVERASLLLSKNLDERLVLSSMDSMIQPQAGEIPGYGGCPEGQERDFLAAVHGNRVETAGTLRDLERARIREAFDKNDGNITRTARELHISRSTLYRKLRES